MKQEQIDQMRKDLDLLNVYGKLGVIAAVAGASRERYKAILLGKADPTEAELSVFNNLKG